MLPRKSTSIDLGTICREKVMPGLGTKETQAMERAIGQHPVKTLYANVAGKIHWYILNAPASLRGKCFGTADNTEEADQAISKLLGSTGNNRTVLA